MKALPALRCREPWAEILALGGGLVDTEGDPGPRQLTAQALRVRPDQPGGRVCVCVRVSIRTENTGAQAGGGWGDDRCGSGRSNQGKGARTSLLDS